MGKESFQAEVCDQEMDAAIESIRECSEQGLERILNDADLCASDMSDKPGPSSGFNVKTSMIPWGRIKR